MNIDPAFAQVLERMRRGVDVPQTEIVPHLLADAPAARQRANYLAAMACREGGKGALALQYAIRATQIGDANGDVIKLCFQLLIDHKRYRDAADLARETIAPAAQSGDRAALLTCFLMYQRAVSLLDGADDTALKMYADRGVSAVMEAAFTPRTLPKLRADILDSGKIRIGFLLAGDDMPESTLVRTVLSLIAGHDTSRFQQFVYSLFPSSEIVAKNPVFASWVESISKSGALYCGGPDSRGLSGLTQLRDAMIRDRLDVVVYSMQVLDHAALAFMRPAPLSCAVNLGNPLGYTQRHIDFSVVFQMHGQMEALCQSKLLQYSFDFEQAALRARMSPPVTRRQLGLPEKSTVIMSGGQAYKFDSEAFWRMVREVLEKRADAVWACGGLEPGKLPPAASQLASSVLARVIPLGWRTDYSAHILPLADIVVDTFPAGGGQSILEAMGHGKPSLSFASNYLRSFSNRDWSPVFEVVDRLDLAVPYGQLDEMISRIIRLIDDPAERARQGAEMKAALEKIGGRPAMSRQFEDAVLEAIRRKLAVQG